MPHADRDTQGVGEEDSHVTGEAKTGGMWLQAKAGQESEQPTPEARQGQGRVLPRLLEGAWTCRHLDLGHLACGTVIEYGSVVLRHPIVVLCGGGHRKQTQSMSYSVTEVLATP